ncbi:MAG: TRAP transporter small permease [Rhodospirillaceae bacterium]|jgi:TRAP-type C4-dicarboxylate transport system permease small subunit
MPEVSNDKNRPTDVVGRFLFSVTYGLALLGGVILCLMALLTTVSVSGRYFFNAPITGDFELIGLGTGIAVFSFLPFCQLMRENVIVDFFLSHTSKRFQSFFDFVGNLSYGLIIVLMTWRTPIGGIEVYNSNQMTLILELPHWWGFPFAVLCLIVLLIVCLYTTLRSFKEARYG